MGVTGEDGAQVRVLHLLGVSTIYVGEHDQPQACGKGGDGEIGEGVVYASSMPPESHMDCIKACKGQVHPEGVCSR